MTGVGVRAETWDDAFALSALVPGLWEALQARNVVDLLFSGADAAPNDAVAGALAADIDLGAMEASLQSRVPAQQAYILLRDRLQDIADYRTLLRATFDRLAVGGWLVITVPHQFLQERKFRLPSRYGARALRLYTPAALTAEIEEALDPTEYRLRVLKDDDEGYDYECDIEHKPNGCQRIVAVLEKIARPSWAGKMSLGDDAEAPAEGSRLTPAIDSALTVTYTLAPTFKGIQTILVLKLDHRGDFLMAKAALARLRERFPQAQLTLVCGPWNVAAAQEIGLFDIVEPFEFFGEDQSTEQAPARDQVMQRFADIMRGRAFDLAIDLRFYEDTRDLLELVSARQRAGFDSWARFPWLDIRLNLPVPTIDGRAEHHLWQADAFSCAAGDRREGAIACSPFGLGRLGALAVWGPYVGLGAGHYDVTLRFDAPRWGGRVRIDVVGHAAQTKFFDGRVRVVGGREVKFAFDLAERVHDVELRVHRPAHFRPGVQLRSAEVRRTKILSVGVHQQECMVLLVELVAMRLNATYSVDATPTPE